MSFGFKKKLMPTSHKRNAEQTKSNAKDADNNYCQNEIHELDSDDKNGNFGELKYHLVMPNGNE